MPAAPFTVHELAELKLPWVVRRRIRRLRGQSGIVLGALMAPDTSRSVSFSFSTVSLAGNGFRLSLASSSNRRTVARRLAAGSYTLTLRADRSRLSSVFEYGVELADGDVFVAVGRPIQRWTVFGRNPEANEWYLGFA
jgi:hypothetical protein